MSTYSNYQNAYKKASVNTLDQNKLIIMLYDGAIKNASFAVQHMKTGEIEKVHNCLVKTKNIVTELMATLNMEQGGDIAKNLQSLYSYMFSQLIEANMEKKTQPIIVVIDFICYRVFTMFCWSRQKSCAKTNYSKELQKRYSCNVSFEYSH